MFGSSADGVAMFLGGVIGGGIGLLLSPMFVFAKRGDNIFLHLIICFVVAFPVAIVSSLSYIPQLAIALVLLAIIATFHLLGKDESATEAQTSIHRRVFILPAVIFGVSVIAAYVYDDLPDDAPSLIEIMGENDMSRHIAAGRKLSKNYGKEPLITGLHHPDARVRNRAAHFLAWFPEPIVFDELVKASRDPDQHVRMWVAFSLGEFGNPNALPTLSTLASDREEIVRLRANESIAKIKKAH